MEKSERNEAKIVFNNGALTVDFKGVWTRHMVDLAHNSMLHKLPSHIASLRSKDIGETPTNKEKSK